ncbi:TetR/AcrR family transcriptional regulator [Tsukamurella ocularis]|uniref:TetR/AcrR family transcriptional regulator n=1 Tax=Tsukamurella ocularis TaxID=1970234 RepID=UPI002167608C|nr:TetR/AcrR family transcriptional regulator [Tsukamurella ocularis]MCS3778574.1 AcrR family transcriptional regulator [Tsukamurella ocularis]MCS3789275.1 AcrR family transcriptional regulator [Tsukamurella ocularis]MCS3853125.1 AcrR family transcriptional regulator [Tsukamurella ocularis]
MARTKQYGGEELELRRAQRRERLMEAGLEVFARDGYSAASVPAVCAEAGLSSRQFYELFANREALLTAIYTEVHANAMASVTAAVDGFPSDMTEVEPWIRIGLGAYFDHFRADPRRVRLCFIEVVGVSPELEEQRRRTRESWSGILDAASRSIAAQGLIDTRDRTFDWTVFQGAVNAATVEYASRPEIELATVTAALMRLITSGVLS